MDQHKHDPFGRTPEIVAGGPSRVVRKRERRIERQRQRAFAEYFPIPQHTEDPFWKTHAHLAANPVYIASLAEMVLIRHRLLADANPNRPKTKKLKRLLENGERATRWLKEIRKILKRQHIAIDPMFFVLDRQATGWDMVKAKRGKRSDPGIAQKRITALRDLDCRLSKAAAMGEGICDVLPPEAGRQRDMLALAREFIFSAKPRPIKKE